MPGSDQRAPPSATLRTRLRRRVPLLAMAPGGRRVIDFMIGALTHLDPPVFI